jgi:8-oxo-dGTP pyrophosphatase MutT (NUDIX family)
MSLTDGLTPLRVEGHTVGWVHPQWCARLLQPPTPFNLEAGAIEIMARLPSFASRSAALAAWTESARERWALPGWRDERTVVRDGDRPLFSIERALMRPLGLELRSVQANVWCVTVAGPLLWIARRAQHKPVEPGKLDGLVAGGIAGFDEPFATLVRECAEEAGIAEPLARQAVPAGTLDIAYATLYDGLPALHREHITLFDLELPAHVIPVPLDGEHEAILPMTPFEARASIAQGSWTREGAQATLELIGRQRWLLPQDSMRA